MPKIEFIHHKGKTLLLVDFSNGTTEEIIPVIEEAKRTIASQQPHSLLTLTDVTNAKFDSDVSERLKAFTLHNKPYVKAGAVVGVTGLRKVLYNAVMQFSGRNLPMFSTIEKAKDWLVEQ